MKFQVFSDKAGEYRWYLRASNGEIIADSAEGYVNKRDALHGIDLIKELNPKTVTFEDLTTDAKSAPVETEGDTATKFEVFQDKAGEYRWYLRASNGEIIADSAEGYVNKRSAFHGIDLIKELNPKTVTFEDLTATAGAAEAATAEAAAVKVTAAEPVAMEEATTETTMESTMETTEVVIEPRRKETGMLAFLVGVFVVVVIILGVTFASL